MVVKKKVKKNVKSSSVRKSKKPERKKRSRQPRYYYAVGRRKRSVAQVRVRVGSGKMRINGEKSKDYFPTLPLQRIIFQAQHCIGRKEGFDIEVKVQGGGIHSQAEAVRHGIARALVRFEPNFRKKLKRAGFLKRDPRKKERKKYGLKRARRAPQWSKR